MAHHIAPKKPRHGAFRRAAILLWIVGTFELLVSSLLATLFAAMARLPQDQLVGAFDMAVRQEQLTLWQDRMGTYLTTLLILGAMPGGLLLLLGFGVRAGRGWATSGAMMAVLTQCAVTSVALFWLTGRSLATGDPAAVSVTFIALGSPLVLLIVTARSLLRAMFAKPGAAEP